MTAFRFRLTSANGEDAGDFSTALPMWRVGDELDAGDGRRRRIRDMLPLDLFDELADGPVVAIWEVEPA